MERADPALCDLVPELQPFCPPGIIADKATYSPCGARRPLNGPLRSAPRALEITGTETDVCVLAAILNAVDRGFRVVVPTDAICSSSDNMHDALMNLYHQRFSQQIETATSAEILAAWR